METNLKKLNLNSASTSASAEKRFDDLDISSDEDDDDEIDDVNNNNVETSVDVGLIDDTDDLDSLTHDDRKLLAIRLSSPFFPSKIGGKPSWLDYTHVPKAEAVATTSTSGEINLACDTCKSQLVFLLQLYAPISDTDKFVAELESADACFHRALFVFVCTNNECNRKSVRLIRSQLERNNDFYAYEAPPREDSYENG